MCGEGVELREMGWGRGREGEGRRQEKRKGEGRRAEGKRSIVL